MKRENNNKRVKKRMKIAKTIFEDLKIDQNRSIKIFFYKSLFKFKKIIIKTCKGNKRIKF